MLAPLLSLVLLADAAPDASPQGPSVTAPSPAADRTSTAPALDPVPINPVLDLFGAFDATWPTGGLGTNAFSVPRALGGVEAVTERWRGRLVVEGVYSTEGGALVGTAGDSQVLRVREAFAGYRWRFLEGRVGAIPSPQFAPLEHAWSLRQLSADGLETFHLATPTDFGASVRAWLPAEMGWVSVAVMNGEGVSQRELNRAKNLEFAATVRPATSMRALTLVGAGTLGSTGTAASRADRVGGGVLWDSGWLGAGATAHAFFGLGDDGGRRGVLLQGFAHLLLAERLFVAVRAERLWRDLAASSDDTVTRLLLGTGVRLPGGVDLLVEAQRSQLSDLARVSLPGAEATSVRLVARLTPFTSTLEDWR